MDTVFVVSIFDCSDTCSEKRIKKVRVAEAACVQLQYTT